MSGMTIIVKTIVKVVVGIILLFGGYLVLHGHISPGGGFGGGVILASAFVLMTLAFGKERTLKKFSVEAATILASIGALIFLITALFGYKGGYFFRNFLANKASIEFLNSGIILICDIAIGILVGAALFIGFINLISFRIKENK